MGFELQIDPGTAVPIGQQIVDGLRWAVAAGGLRPGEAVPSVREMAVRLRVNPNTVARAYRRLVEDGILSVRRGEGTFVADPPAGGVEGLREQELSLAAGRFVEVARRLGAGVQQATRAVERAWKEVDRG